jgi:sugar/nucleoside kinase (ribokinase family)
VTKLHADGIGTVCGRLYVGTAESIPPSELIDTTGAGDAFIGAFLYGNILPLFYIFFLWPLKIHR